MKPGPKPKFKARMYEQARKLCLLGATNTDLADFFNVSLRTVRNWIESDEKFTEILRSTKLIVDNMVERRLYERATGYSHPETHVSNFQGMITKTELTKHYPPDTTACIFWLKNRKPEQWRDRHEIEHGGKAALLDFLERLGPPDKPAEPPAEKPVTLQ